MFVRTEPSKGDIIIYSLTPSFYIVHRYIGDYPNENKYIITKGDANPTIDPFLVSRSMVKGVVFFVLQREIWIPLFAFSVAIALFKTFMIRIVGVSSVMTYLTIIIFILVVYGFTQPMPKITKVELPLVYLSRAELNSETRTLVIGYVGALQLSDAEVYVDEVRISASFNATHIIAIIPKELAWRIGEKGWTNVQVVASLNHIGKLTGNYTVKVYPKPLSIGAVNGSLLIGNINGFPVSVNITFKYAYYAGDAWKYYSIKVIVDGGKTILVNPPENSRYVYADVIYVLAGDKKWVQIPVRY